jgi:hypothetical protein
MFTPFIASILTVNHGSNKNLWVYCPNIRSYLWLCKDNKVVTIKKIIHWGTLEDKTKTVDDSLFLFTGSEVTPLDTLAEFPILKAISLEKKEEKIG